MKFLSWGVGAGLALTGLAGAAVVVAGLYATQVIGPPSAEAPPGDAARDDQTPPDATIEEAKPEAVVADAPASDTPQTAESVAAAPPPETPDPATPDIADNPQPDISADPAVPTETAQPEPEQPATTETAIAQPDTANGPAEAAQPEVAQPAPTPEIAAAAPPAPGAAPQLEPASFDLVRADPDGAILVAGRAAPGSDVIVLVDGARAGEARADGSGRFVAFLDLDPGTAARVLTLRTILGAATVESAQEVILAPAAPAAPVTTALVDAQIPEPAQPNAVQADAVATTDQPDENPTPAEGLAVAATTTDPDGTAASSDGVVTASNETSVALSETDGTATNTAAQETAVDSAAPLAAQTVIAAVDVQAPVAPASPIAAPEVPAAQPAPAPTAPVVLLSDSDGVRVLSGPTPQAGPQPATAPDARPVAQSEIALDTISYDASGDVALAGRSGQTGDGFVRVYLDNRPIASAPVGADGRWQADLPQIDTGLYRLRVDRLDADGAVVARVESPFKREAPEVLAAAGRAVDAPVQAVTVQPGNTLWAIARERYGEGLLYVKVFEANTGQIRNPDLIYPGQIFTLPD